MDKLSLSDTYWLNLFQIPQFTHQRIVSFDSLEFGIGSGGYNDVCERDERKLRSARSRVRPRLHKEPVHWSESQLGNACWNLSRWRSAKLDLCQHRIFVLSDEEISSIHKI